MKCGHNNKHYAVDGKYPLDCVLEKGHTGDHEADYMTEVHPLVWDGIPEHKHIQARAYWSDGAFMPTKG